MIAVWLEGGTLAVRDDLPRPAAGPDESIVRVSAAGICGTDLELLRGYRPFAGVPGHEFVGVVEEGPVDWIGHRVVSEINVTCASRPHVGGRCDECTAGRTAHCARREVIGIRGRDGAFAQWVETPVANLRRVPDSIPDEEAVFIEPLAAAFRILEQVETEHAMRVLVVGPGRLGQLVARALATGPSQVLVAGRSEAGLARARGAGLETAHVDELAGHYDLVAECTGSPSGFRVARRLVKPGGTIVVKSTYANELTIDISSIVVDEIRVIGSRCGPFGRAIRALERREVKVSDLIDGRLALTDAVRGFERASESGVAKILLFP